MKKLLVKSLVLLAPLALIAGGSASAQTITFDDIAIDSIGAIYDGYAGFNWDNFGYIKNTYHPGSGYDNGVVSGEYAGYNLNAYVATMEDVAFMFTGAYFTAAWNTDLNIRIDGYDNNNSIINTATIVVDYDAPTLFMARWTNLYKLSFTSWGGTGAVSGGSGAHFAVDNLTVNQCQMDPITPVPEPATMLLFGTGLAGLAAVARRRKTQA